LLRSFIDDFGALFSPPELPGLDARAAERRALIALIVEMAQRSAASRSAGTSSRQELEKRFLESLGPDREAHAAELLDLARASYRLRDDDNISLEKVKHQLQKALDERKRRGNGQTDCGETVSAAGERPGKARIRARQLVGQPAGPGLARGSARVILGSEDLFAFKAGEILVCDSVSPEMTFVAPLAAGIVERRGGMLIHGAIIAREYGLPCVTGVPRATTSIMSGSRITVDGYLGIVIVD
jgi:pyruvate,water dikinase